MLALFGLPAAAACSAGALWQTITGRLVAHGALAGEHAAGVAPILERGTLARRIVTSLGGAARGDLQRVYRRLAACLEHGESFV